MTGEKDETDSRGRRRSMSVISIIYDQMRELGYLPEKKNHNGLIMGSVSAASFFAGISLIGIWIRPVAAVPVLIGSLAYITLVAYANFRKEK